MRVSYEKLENRAPKSHSFLIEHLNSCEFLECYQPFEVSTHYLFCLVTHSSIFTFRPYLRSNSFKLTYQTAAELALRAAVKTYLSYQKDITVAISIFFAASESKDC